MRSSFGQLKVDVIYVKKELIIEGFKELYREK
jgi:hypothetical protein